MKFVRFLPHRAWRRTWVAPSKSGAVERYSLGELGDFGLDEAPVHRTVSGTRNQHNSGTLTLLAHAPDVQFIATNIDQFARRGRRRCISWVSSPGEAH